ncbi:MAG: hypothetical protein PHT60_15075 [Acidiphilium sp.]|nr:hypothetical protein [Acidiphilium sp.]MDD4937085.1 hypothetical protein [Acidiphilium sp.]
MIDDKIARPETLAAQVPVLFVRRGRGRTGGSTLCDWLIQRARRGGRRAKALDGDLRSRTLIDLYPAQVGRDHDDPDAATAPANESLEVVRSWLLGELNAMAEDRVSRLLDLGGGDRVIQDFVQDLSLVGFTDRFNIRLVQAYFLGPDEEDFRHVVSTIDHAQFDPRSTILYLNEGVVRTGQTPFQVFAPLTLRDDFIELVGKGIRTVTIPRVICLDDMRSLGLTINDVLSNRTGRAGRRAPPTMQIMVEDWCRRLETAHVDVGVGDLLP